MGIEVFIMTGVDTIEFRFMPDNAYFITEDSDDIYLNTVKGAYHLSEGEFHGISSDMPCTICDASLFLRPVDP